MVAATFFSQHPAIAQSVNLGTAGSYGVLAGQAITSTGATVVNGNVGISPNGGSSVTGFPPGIIHGVLNAANGPALQAKNDLSSAYFHAQGLTPTQTFAPIFDLGGLNLVSGVYNDPSSFGLTGTLTLNGNGNKNSIFVFQAGSTLTTASSSQIVLINGAQACHVFWAVGSSATLGSFSVFDGTIMALTSITMNNGVVLNGRALALNGSVTMIADTITVPVCATNGPGPTPTPGPVPVPTNAPVAVVTVAPGVVAIVSNAAEEAQIIKAITPTMYQSMGTLAFNLANAQNSELVQRLWGLRVAGTGFSMTGFPDNTPVYEEYKNPVNDKNPVGTENKNPTTSDYKNPVKPEYRTGLGDRWGAFVDANGVFAKANSANALPTYNSESGGVTTGLTYKWNDSFGTGIYAGYEGSYNRFPGVSQGYTSRMIDNSVRFGLFGTYGQPDGKGFYADALVGGGYNNYQVSRNISFGSFNQTANSSPGAGELDTMIAGGYDFKAGNWTFGPMAVLQYTYLGVNGVNETGAQSLDFNSGGWNSSSLLSTVGGQLGYTWKVNKKVVVVPQINLGWQHEFMQNPYAINGNLGGGPTFSNWSSTPIRDWLYTGVGFTVAVGARWNASLFYNAAAGNQNLVSENVFASVGVNF